MGREEKAKPKQPPPPPPPKKKKKKKKMIFILIILNECSEDEKMCKATSTMTHFHSYFVTTTSMVVTVPGMYMSEPCSSLMM